MESINIGNEEFHPLLEGEGHFISKSGKIFSTKKNRFLSISVKKDGYCLVGLFINNKMALRYMHILLAKQFIPNPENKPEVNHIDFNKANNSLNNLEWTTHRENVMHSVNNGKWNDLSNYHEIHGHYIITDESRKRMSDKKKGKNHPKYKGDIHTPFGKFESSYEAGKAENVSHRTIQERIKSKSEKFKDYYILAYHAS